jgi:hypothetical protein
MTATKVARVLAILSLPKPVLSGAFDFAMRDVIGRVRPANYYYCLRQGGTDCLDGPESRRSFPSGHFTETTTATARL